MAEIKSVPQGRPQKTIEVTPLPFYPEFPLPREENDNLRKQVNNNLQAFTEAPYNYTAQGEKVINLKFNLESLKKNLLVIEKIKDGDLSGFIQKDPYYKLLIEGALKTLPLVITNNDYDQFNQREFNCRERAAVCFAKLLPYTNPFIKQEEKLQEALITIAENTKNVDVKKRIIASFALILNQPEKVYQILKGIATDRQDPHNLEAISALTTAILETKKVLPLANQKNIRINEARFPEVLEILEKAIPGNEELSADPEKANERFSKISASTRTLAMVLNTFGLLERSEFDSISKKYLDNLESKELSGKSIVEELVYFCIVNSSKNNHQDVLEALDKLNKNIEKRKDENWGELINRNDQSKLKITTKMLQDLLVETIQVVKFAREGEIKKEKFFNGNPPHLRQIKNNMF